MLAEILAQAPCPLVIEIGDAPETANLIDGPLGQIPGVLIAIDDAGAGYESLARIEKLRPAFLKLHRDAVSGLENDSARQMFVKSLVTFADQHDCKIIAEGVETEAERDALRDAGRAPRPGLLRRSPGPHRPHADPHHPHLTLPRPTRAIRSAGRWRCVRWRRGSTGALRCRVLPALLRARPCA